MLSEERVILMTKMASYEEHEGKKYMKIGRYFRDDYIAVQILKSIFCATLAFAWIFAIFFFIMGSPWWCMGLALTEYVPIAITEQRKALNYITRTSKN